MTTLTLTGDKAWTRTDINNADGIHAAVDVIDATAASWNCRSTGSPQQEYPFRIRNLPLQVEVRGGTINGLFDLTMDWGYLYGEGNSAAIFLQNCGAGSSITDVRVDRVWDAIRIIGVQNWLFKDSWISRTRDDAFEADQGYNGTVRNVLAEDVFMGFSFGNANTPVSSLTNTVLVENTLVKMGLYFDDVPNTHGSPLKAAANTPKLVLKNNVFAIQNVNHSNWPRMELAFSKVQASSSGNYWLNLTDDPLPGNYPDLPPSFTYLSGSVARDYWDAARSNYFGGPPPDPEPDPEESQFNDISITPDGGVIHMNTSNGAFTTSITVGVKNASTFDTKDVSITIT